jgi:hypothetical protein
MRYKFFLIGMLVAAAVAGCAKAGMPSGGPKDNEPPKVLRTEPENGATQWTANEFAIFFDEYVTVKDADKNILVSPPMDTKPEYVTKGHAVVVKIKDSLRANTTYLFQFKEGIVDYNEGNPLASFEYVFSTGSGIDSMTIRGQVLDALTHRPYQAEGAITVAAFGLEQMARFDSVQNIYLDSLLRADTTGTLAEKVDRLHAGDSIVAKEKPMYMTRCDKEGRFEMNHLREGSYRVLAFEDGDNNLLLKAGEAVAFLDTLVLAQHMPPPVDTTKADTSRLDSTRLDSNLVDSIRHDTLTRPSDSLAELSGENRVLPTVLHISLNKVEAQRVSKAEMEGKGRIKLSTVLPLTEHYQLRPLDTTGGRMLYIKANAKHDTLTVWTQDKNCDSITLLLTDKDIRDTLKLTYRAPKNTPTVGKVPAQAVAKGAGLLRGQVAAKHAYYDTLWIGFDRPVRGIAQGVSDSLVTVFNQVDSTTSRCGIRWIDSCIPTGYYRAMIDYRGKPGGKYKFSVPAMSFTDIYGGTHRDSLVFATEYTKVEEYGNIVMTIDSLQMAWEPRPVLIQLLNEKGDVVRQHPIGGPEKVTFDHLKGGKYALRAVHDQDSNGTWTAGDYWKRRQPEEVVYFEKVLELRENWDMEEHWTLRPGATAMPQMGSEAKDEKKQ